MLFLEDTAAKVARANVHVQTLEDEIARVFNPDAYVISHEVDIERGEQRFRLMRHIAPPSLDWSLLIGDALYNFRSALDHIVYQLVIANSEEPTRRNAFPVFIEPKLYKTESRSKLQGVCPDAIAVIDRLQPCNGGRDALWELEELGNKDKHRRLHLVTVSMEKGALDVPMTSIDDVEFIPYVGPVEDGTVLLTVRPHDVEVKFNPTFTIAFDEPEVVLPITDVIYALKRIHNAVEHARHSFYKVYTVKG